MKNRRTIVMAFLLCACLIVGMGYAAVTTNLDVTGNVNVSGNPSEQGNYDQYIQFGTVAIVSGIKADSTDYAVVGNQTTTDDSVINDLLTITLYNTAEKANTTMAINGDKAVFTVTVKNLHETDAATIDASATHTYEGFTVAWASSATTIAAKGEVTLTVTVTLTETPTADAAINANISFPITVTNATTTATN